MDELLDLVNESDQVIAQKRRSEIYSATKSGEDVLKKTSDRDGRTPTVREMS